jgi:hypothetical protein
MMRKQLSIFAAVLILSVVAGTTIVQAQSLNAQQVLDKALAAKRAWRRFKRARLPVRLK